MRDFKRIKRILEKIEFIWSVWPDQRFGQLLENMSRFDGLYPYNDGAIYLWGKEDHEVEEVLDKVITEIKKGATRR